MAGNLPPEGYKRARRPVDTTWNPDVPMPAEFVPRAEGWNYSFGSPERLALWKSQQNAEVNAAIEIERQKPPEERFRPPERYNPLSLDLLSTGEYASGAFYKKLSGRGGFREGFLEKTEPSDVFIPEQEKFLQKLGTAEDINPFTGKPFVRSAETEAFLRHQAQANIETVESPVGRFIFNTAQDPFMYVSGVRTGVTVYINGKNARLTEEGAKVLSGMLQSAPLKEADKVRYLFSNMLKKDPYMYSQFVQKEGLRIAWTNLELVPRKYLPWTWVAPAGKRAIEIGKGGWDTVASAFGRQYANLLAKIPKNAPLPPPPSFNEMRYASQAELKAARQAVYRQVDELVEHAQKQMKGYANPRFILTEYAENPAIRAMFPELDIINKRWDKLRKQMAAIEKAEGVLHSERVDYLRHYLTSAAKNAKGIVGEKVKAPFDIRRSIEGRISEINSDSIKKNGYKLFNDDFFFLVRKRMEEHEEVMNAIKLVNSAGQQFGKSAKEVAGNSDYVPSSFPQLKGIFLPKAIEEALKSDRYVKQVRELMRVRTKYDVARDVVMYPLRKTYDFQRWTLHAWEKLQTRYFPAFYAVNYYGGKFMAWLGGSADLADDAAAIARMKKSTDPSKVLITSELDPRIKYTKERLDELVLKYNFARVDPMGVETGKRDIGWVARRGWEMEEELRTAMFFNRLRKGDTPDDAYAYVIKYQFDYTSELQGAEKILSDWIPFYRWQKNAIPFFTAMTFESYGKMRAFGALAAGTWYSPQAEVIKPYMPEWMKTRVNIFMGGDSNNVVSVNLPISTVPDAINKLSSPGNATQFLGPIPQIAYQEYTGKETFTGQNITSPEMFPVKFMLNRHIQTMEKITSGKPWWEITTELTTGVSINQANDWLAYSGLLERNSETLVHNAIRRLNGRYHGCGF